MRSVPTRTRFLFLFLALAALGLPLHGQQTQKGQSQPTFRVRIDYVEVDAIVHDKTGMFLPDLKRDEFEIVEDGKRQDIASFDLVNVPVEPRSEVALITSRTIEPDIVTNERPTGRVYLIVLDDLHVAPNRTVPARNIAKNFIQKNMAPNDVAAIVPTSGDRDASQDFTNSKRRLLAAVERFVGRKTVSPALSSISNDPALRGAGTLTGQADPLARERLDNARTSLATLSSLAAFAGTIHNRKKSIVLVGEGIDYNFGKGGFERSPEPKVETPKVSGGDTGQDSNAPPPPIGFINEGSASRELRDNLKTFVDTANRANVTLYALDPRVFTQGGDDLVDIGSGSFSDSASDETQNERSRLGMLWDDIEAAQDNLRTMATETGGFAATGSIKAVAGAFDRIRDENSHYYILGYYPATVKNDGKFHRIEVRVKRPGAIVVARKGYVAPKEKANVAAPETKEGTSAPLKEALGGALPTVGLPISVIAAPFRGSGDNHSVLVMLQTPPGAVKFTEKDGRAIGDLELSFVAMDYKNKTRGGEHLNVTMPLRPETATVVNRTGLLVQSRVTLPPGRYILRVGARDANSEKVGSVHYDVEVPDFAKAPLSMSGILVASTEAMAANPRPDPELKRIFGDETPAVIRDFRESDVLSVLAEIYDTKFQTTHDIDIAVTVIGEDGREAYRHTEKRSTGDVQGTNGGFGYLLKVPLAGMAPGSYLLRVEAKSRLDVDKPVSRETFFRVAER